MAYKSKEDQKAYSKKYRAEHREQNIQYQKKWRENNPEYSKNYRQRNIEKSRIYGREYYKNNSEKRNEIAREYHKNNKKKCNEITKRYKKKVRYTVLKMISGGIPHCVRCGCDDERFLEVNHKNGGGNKERQKGKRAQQFYWDIYMKRRKTDDLELLCRVCNSRHYLELKYGKLPYKIIWNKGESK